MRRRFVAHELVHVTERLVIRPLGRRDHAAWAHARGFRRVEAHISPENVASIALARAVGFRREGTLPAFRFEDGAWRDKDLYVARGDGVPPFGRSLAENV